MHAAEPLSEFANPLATDGFEFVEYTAPDTAELGRACAMAFRVKDAPYALRTAVAAGARQVKGSAGPMELNIPAIEGIGGSLIYLIDRYSNPTIYDVDFITEPGTEPSPPGAGLVEVDHLTHNVAKGRMDYFYDFYHRIFNFREQQYFDISGEYTGLTSRALCAPCGKIRRTWDELQARGLKFMTAPPESYYEMLEERLPGHGQSVADLQKRGILLDGADGRYLAQIFTQTLIGPIFFEIIERKGDDGFGQGNFRALFVSMERDQIRRGSLKVPPKA
jgi:4-hydroxyphenylpyruvate dioxygenase